MIWVDAARFIALVQDAPIRWDLAVREFPRNTVCVCTAQTAVSVARAAATILKSAGPQPALARFIDATPERFRRHEAFLNAASTSNPSTRMIRPRRTETMP